MAVKRNLRLLFLGASVSPCGDRPPLAVERNLRLLFGVRFATPLRWALPTPGRAPRSALRKGVSPLTRVRGGVKAGRYKQDAKRRRRVQDVRSRTKTSLNPPKTRLFDTFLFVVIDILNILTRTPTQLYAKICRQNRVQAYFRAANCIAKYIHAFTG